MAIQNLFIFLFLSLVHAQNYCPTSYCGETGVAIQFPFWLQGQQPQNCGPIGFNLSCDAQKNVIPNIPYSGDFYVSSINYYLKRVVLSDPNNCLPRRLLSLNLSSSPFIAVSYQRYTFLSCPKGLVSSSYVINCLSNITTDIASINYEADLMIPSKCKKIYTITLPVSSPYGLPVNLELTWNVPAIGAVNKPPFLRIVTMSLVISAVVICMMGRDEPQHSGSNQTSNGAGLPDTTTSGLDKFTIETYRKITISESHRIEGPNGVTCTICLEDYVPQDTIRFLPECQHCFHVECIDKWLSIKAKCPICRTFQTFTIPEFI